MAGLTRFGFPITKVFNSKSTNGQTYPTQYLERAVFEQHPENKGTQYEVLGRLLGTAFAGGRIQTDPNFQPVAEAERRAALVPRYEALDRRQRCRE